MIWFNGNKLNPFCQHALIAALVLFTSSDLSYSTNAAVRIGKAPALRPGQKHTGAT